MTRNPTSSVQITCDQTSQNLFGVSYFLVIFLRIWGHYLILQHLLGLCSIYNDYFRDVLSQVHEFLADLCRKPIRFRGTPRKLIEITRTFRHDSINFLYIMLAGSQCLELVHQPERAPQQGGLLRASVHKMDSNLAARWRRTTCVGEARKLYIEFFEMSVVFTVANFKFLPFSDR